MVIGANRDVLYFDTSFHKHKNLQTKLEIPLHKNRNQNRECPCLLRVRASLTIEAAFCGTMFFLALFTFFYLFRLLNGYEEQLLALDTAVKEYECFGTRFSTLKELTEKKYLIWDEKEKVCCIQNREGIPFIGERFFSISLYQQLCINSYEGKSMVPEKESGDICVYIAEHGTVYHLNEHCVYLNPQISQVTYREALEKRNRSGAKYYACKSCGSMKDTESLRLVYITPYGDSWHTRKDCSRLKRNVRKVSLSSIGNLPACSKCGQ